jgi:serine/threonine protein kinase
MNGPVTTQAVIPIRDEPLFRGAPQIRGYPRIGKHVLLDRLGSGAMGSVYLAYRLSVSRLEAVKFLNPKGNASEDLLRRFTHEAQTMANLESTNIVKVYDVEAWSGRHYISMELINGETLHARVRRNGRLPALEAATIARDAALGLAAIHEAKIIHRDIKPANIMMTSRGIVKVSDLGVAKSESPDATDHTGHHTIIGTPQYMAPEQFNGEVSPSSDVYALALTLRFMVAGHDPVQPGEFTRIMRQVIDGLEHPREAHPDMPADLAEIIFRATNREPGLRTPDASAFLADLEGWIRAQGGPADLASISPSSLGSKLPTSDLLRQIKAEADRVPGTPGDLANAQTIFPASTAVPPTIAPTGAIVPPTIPGDPGAASRVPTVHSQELVSPVPRPEPRSLPAWAMILIGAAVLIAGASVVIFLNGQNDWLNRGQARDSADSGGVPRTAPDPISADSAPSDPRTSRENQPDQIRPEQPRDPTTVGDRGGHSGDGARTADIERPEHGGVGGASGPGPGESNNPGDNARTPIEEEKQRAARASDLADRVQRASDEIDRAAQIGDPVNAIASLAGVVGALDRLADEANPEDLSGTPGEHLPAVIRQRRDEAINAADHVMQRTLDAAGPAYETSAMTFVNRHQAEMMLGLAEAGSNNTLRVLIGSLQWYPKSEDAEIDPGNIDILEKAHDLAVGRGLDRAYYHRGEFRRKQQMRSAYLDFAAGQLNDPDCKFRLAYLLLDMEGTTWDDFPQAERDRIARSIGGVNTPESRIVAAHAKLNEAIQQGSHRARRLLGQVLMNKDIAESVELMVQAAIDGNRLAQEQLKAWLDYNRSRGSGIVPITDQHLERLRQHGIRF